MSLSDIFKEIVFPSVCVVCGLPTDGGPICSKCYSRIVSHFTVTGLQWIEQIWVLGRYQGQLKELILRFKFGGDIGIGRALSFAMMMEFGNRVREFDMVVPVPMERLKLLYRGFNQSEVLAKEISRISGVKFANPVFKVRKVKEQVGLTVKERWENVKDAFGVKEAGRIKGKKLLLVDDVVTTGATLSFVAKSLLRAGAKCVSGIAIAG